MTDFDNDAPDTVDTQSYLYKQEHTKEENLQNYIQGVESIYTDRKAHIHLMHLKIMLKTRLPGGK